MQWGQITTLGTMWPIICDKCVGSLTSPVDHVTLKMQKTGLIFYSPYPRRIECLVIICRFNYNCSLFSTVMTLSVGLISGSNPQPPTKQSSVLPTELTRRGLTLYIILRIGWGYSIVIMNIGWCPGIRVQGKGELPCEKVWNAHQEILLW